MIVVDIDSLKPRGAQVATFHGFEHGASVSFFIVEFLPGQGPKKHRHPYEETFILLEGEIEVITDDEPHKIGGGKIVIVPAGVWHEFKNWGDQPVQMINIHPAAQMITEWA
jgi:quercetin dioxygenase-like cupin family protein